MGVTVRGLRKRFGATEAVAGVSFDVPTGALFAFLGTNGAGKSTTIGCLTTVVAPDAGDVEIDGLRLGRDDEEIRRSIGVVFQNSMLDPLLSGRENLRMRAQFYGVGRAALDRRVDELTGLLQLDEFLDRRYGRLSGGQKRRIDIARALLNEPRVIFLDEPTAGLDPQSRERVWAAIRELRTASGATVFLTTHYMEETEAADRVCIIDHGRVIADDTPASLRRTHSASVLTLRFRDPETRVRRLRDGDAEIVEAEGATAVLAVEDAAAAREILASGGGDVIDFEFRHGTMDDVFLALTGREGIA